MKAFNIRNAAIFALAGSAVFIGHRSYRWDQESASLTSRLVERIDTVIRDVREHPGQQKQAWDDLPQVVQRYLQRVLSSNEAKEVSDTGVIKPPFLTSVPSIRFLRFRQHGFMRLQPNQNWLPFEARQTIGAGHQSLVGFVWECSMSMIGGVKDPGESGFMRKQRTWWRSFMPVVTVRDAWASYLQQGVMEASFLKVFSLIPLSMNRGETNKNLLLRGEMMRWLGEAFLIPTALLPDAGLVTWHPTDTPNSAILHMDDPTTGIGEEVTVSFDEETFSIVIQGDRPHANRDTYVMRPWLGVLSAFQRHNGVDIPTQMKAGWMNEQSEIDFYFVAENFDFEFDFIPPDIDEPYATRPGGSVSSDERK